MPRKNPISAHTSVASALLGLAVAGVSPAGPPVAEPTATIAPDTLSAAKLEDGHVRLNGRTLAPGDGDALPPLQGTPVAAGRTLLAPATITFLAMANAKNPACR